MPSLSLTLNNNSTNIHYNSTAIPPDPQFSVYWWHFFTYGACGVLFIFLLFIVLCCMSVVCMIRARRRRKLRQQQLPLYQLEYSDDEDEDLFFKDDQHRHYNINNGHSTYIKPSISHISTVNTIAANQHNTYNLLSSHSPPKLSFETD